MYRILLIAEAANPEWVSVPLVGWSHATALSEIHDCHLVTQLRNAAAIRRIGLQEGVEFTAIDSEKVAKPIWHFGNLIRGGKGKGWTTTTALSSLSYYYFEFLVWKQFGDAINAGKFDIVHRITPLSPTIPSLIAKKCAQAKVPFVLGPLNGGVPWPEAFNAARHKEKEWLSYVRSAYKLLPGYWSTRKYASAILIGSCDTWKQMPATFHHKCFYIPENAVDSNRFSEHRKRKAKRPVQVVFLGRLVPYKGADMLVEAAAPLIRSGSVRLKIIGDGPQMSEIKEFVDREKLSDGVELTGWIDHRQVQAQLVEADLLAFPSIREFGGGVVLEAMALGLVPIVMNYGGPAELVTPGTGYLVEMGSRQQIVERFRANIGHLVANPEEIDRKSPLAIQRIHDLFTWDVKAKQTCSVYNWVLDQGRKPELTFDFFKHSTGKPSQITTYEQDQT